MCTGGACENGPRERISCSEFAGSPRPPSLLPLNLPDALAEALEWLNSLALPRGLSPAFLAKDAYPRQVRLSFSGYRSLLSCHLTRVADRPLL